MQRKRLLWQLYPSYLLIILISLLAVSLYASQSIYHFYQHELAREFQARATLLIPQIREDLESQRYSAIDRRVKQLGKLTSTRITVILEKGPEPGKVIADSDEQPERMDNHNDRPEVQEVLQGQTGERLRYSYTLHKDMLYVAVPIRENQHLAGIIRMAVSAKSIKGTLNKVYSRIALSGLLIACCAAGLSFVTARRITRPLEEMKRGADHFAQGELNYRLVVPETQEMATLAEGLNHMAEDIGQRIGTLIQQRNEQQAELSSRVEGVLAIDMEERIISINEAGARLLQVNASEMGGRSIQEVVRNIELQEFVRRTLTSEIPVEGDIVLRDNGERYLQAHGTILHDARSEKIGAVIVLDDVTRLSRLETVRRDIVANVSHELKTPITSIKGFVETLLDGGLKNSEDAERFLKIVARQTDRLNAIIEDILSLSRIENQTEKGHLTLEKCRVRDVLNSAIQLCQLQAAAKAITIDVDCDEDLSFQINAPLIEQAVVNLVDNAIKYSDPGKSVKVAARAVDHEMIIRVIDKGCGIEIEYLPRIFERFYRVDKARSRKLGGTGLGLSIVKHIALAHQGSVEVESAPGQGSTFIIRLPANKI